MPVGVGASKDTLNPEVRYAVCSTVSPQSSVVSRQRHANQSHRIHSRVEPRLWVPRRSLRGTATRTLDNWPQHGYRRGRREIAREASDAPHDSHGSSSSSGSRSNPIGGGIQMVQRGSSFVFEASTPPADFTPPSPPAQHMEEECHQR